MRLFFLFFIAGLFLIAGSCRRNSSSDKRALSICNCYDQIHTESALSDNEEDLQQKVNACNELFSNTLSSLDSIEKVSFMKAYRECQEQ